MEAEETKQEAPTPEGPPPAAYHELDYQGRFNVGVNIAIQAVNQELALRKVNPSREQREIIKAVLCTVAHMQAATHGEMLKLLRAEPSSLVLPPT